MLTTTQVKILVPGHHDMVRLMGARDELLKIIEAAFETHILVRGNEIVLTGDPEETERVSRLFAELLELLERGHVLTSEAVGRSIDIIKIEDEDTTPSKVLSDTVIGHAHRQTRQAQDRRAEDATSTRSGRTRSRSGSAPPGSGKTYLAVASAIRCVEGERGLAHRSDQTGGRGRGATRVPPR